VLENYQTPEGIEIPKVLQPFMCGVKEIPFQRELPKTMKKAREERLKTGNVL
jgi:seryl-tRNA synthetase